MTASLDFARASYREISLYAPNRAPARTDLSDNTSLWGPPPAVTRTIHEAAAATITRYPSLYTKELKQALAFYAGVEPTMLVTGCGSDDVLDSAIRAFAEPGDVIAFPDPSFAMIPIFAQMNGLRSVAVPLTSDFDVDPERFLATQAKITYLCSPNNPTGTSLTRRSIERIVGEAPGIVIIDEAYAEFAAGNCLDLLRVSPRLLITRTLSKAFGMAGLRIGYAVGNAALVDEVEKSRGPYKVNAIAERAAVAAFAENMAWVQTLVRESIENRDRMIGALQTFGLRPLPSDANFVLVPVTGALAIDAALRQRGIAVRPFCALPDIGDALRISVAPWPMLDECLSALGEILQEQNA